MASKTLTVSDISGMDGAVTIPFSIGDQAWEVDLVSEEVEALHHALSPYVAVARSIEARPRVTRKARRSKAEIAASPAPELSESQKARIWLREQGITVGRGKIAKEKLELYRASLTPTPEADQEQEASTED